MLRIGHFSKALMGGFNKVKVLWDVLRQNLKYRQILVSLFSILFLIFMNIIANIELKNIVPYSKNEDTCFICKEKLKIERD